jgi:hypothetical protein
LLLRLNRKGQFSIIAALLVAVVLVAAVMTTYSAIRYSSTEEQPQILSSIDETNLGLKEILGFTVGYYGSVLKVTGNVTYAQQLATNYLRSGLTNMGDVQPEWGAVFDLKNLTLSASWFSNNSYSQGSLTVNYNLTGLGIYGASYKTSTRLELQIQNSATINQAELVILRDEAEPLINLGKNNLKLYQYDYIASNWNLTSPTKIASYANGTYILDLPSGVTSNAYVIEVSDNRGLMVLASSFTQFTSKLTWNSTAYRLEPHFVETADPQIGTHSNFASQQTGPDGVYDTLTEAAHGVVPQPCYPTSWNGFGTTTTLMGGALSDLQGNNQAYMSFHAYGTNFAGSARFGNPTRGGGTITLSSVLGSRFTLNQAGLANSISAYLRFNSVSGILGNNNNNGNNGDAINDTIRGQRFTSPTSPVEVQSISAYIYCTLSPKNMKAAIYDNSGNLVASSIEQSVPAGGSPVWRTFSFASPPTLTESTNYLLVVWSETGSGVAILRYSNTNGGNGRYVSQTYGGWSPTITPQTNTYRYSIYCNYNTEFRAKAAIYSNIGVFVAETQEKVLGTIDNWVTFNFATQQTLTQATDYVLAVWSSDTANVDVYQDNNINARRSSSAGTYGIIWPTPLTDGGNQRELSIYCTYAPANQYTAQVEFTGSSNTPLPWTDLAWIIDASANQNDVAATLQLYNWNSGAYPVTGDGFMAATLETTADSLGTQTINNYSNFISGNKNWRILVNATKLTTTPFDLKLDLVQYTPEIPNYSLDLHEQWLTIDTSYMRQDLCIKTGALGAEPLIVQVRHGDVWMNLMTLTANYFNNASLTPYINSSSLMIRFVGSNDLTDITQDSYNIDCVYIKDERDITFLVNRQQSSFTLEVLQNGTMRWLGQNMNLTSQTIPIPPIPIKAIHINQTVCGINKEVPFQIEDWASNYQIPLGLTSNTTVFSNRQMIVILLNSAVSDFTIWWNGSDVATQTSLAYTNRFFTADNTDAMTYNNGNLTLLFSAGTVKATVAGTSTYSTATFMRANQEVSSYGSGTSLVIHHGVVRDVAMEEAEWGTTGSGIGGADGCPNVYANIIILLPANATYYNYQLRLMFINSTQSRSITDLCPVKLTTSLTSPILQTENATLADFPIVVNGTATYANYTRSSYTEHHFMQFIVDSGKGAGVMFSDVQNERLYAFDNFPSSTSKGALKTSSDLLEFLSVSSGAVAFRTAYDITWQGAVATYDTANTPICDFYDATTPMGLWILAEYPPTLAITPKS